VTTRDFGGVRDGYHSVNAYLVVEGVERLVAFLEQVFDAKERGNREIAADATIAHAEVVIGDSVLMLSESSSKYPSRPSVLFAYVADVDRVFECAIDAGASPILSPEDQTWGDRVAGFYDPHDNRWWIATQKYGGV